jgi:hypothetical protein
MQGRRGLGRDTIEQTEAKVLHYPGDRVSKIYRKVSNKLPINATHLYIPRASNICDLEHLTRQ